MWLLLKSHNSVGFDTPGVLELKQLQGESMQLYMHTRFLLPRHAVGMEFANCECTKNCMLPTADMAVELRRLYEVRCNPSVLSPLIACFSALRDIAHGYMRLECVI
jgi:hypothetical protein